MDRLDTATVFVDPNFFDPDFADTTDFVAATGLVVAPDLVAVADFVDAADFVAAADFVPVADFPEDTDFADETAAPVPECAVEYVRWCAEFFCTDVFDDA